MTNKAKAWQQSVTIPTYEVGKSEKTPIFLENRVYQGSSGVVYPYPVIESIGNEAVDYEYKAVWLENEYIKVMILPELGGRVQMAYDKVRNRHFVYYNSVVKPALVGLAGPWISGGIEFNWPQHHRPSTYLPVDSTIEEHPDGSVTVWINEQERMFHQKGMAGFTLRPGHAYLEIEGRLYNRTPMPQTFLWWANPAVKVNDEYRSIFPPDVNAVFDHGKRAVSSFPIATGTYYKMDYSSGVDIANYKNIKVPTSYMAVNSRYDFEGGYENDSKGGMLHVASHHFSPGKKQWTWGNGDFGRAWDRNLTDTDGPYIELMAGVFTENQPDFTWLMPFEQKLFKQYFMPYHDLPNVKNATKDFVMDVEPCDATHLKVRIYATSQQVVSVVCVAADGSQQSVDNVELTPADVFECIFKVADVEKSSVQITDVCEPGYERNGRILLQYAPEPDEIRRIPDPAEAALTPSETKSVEQLYLTGLHLEQYRHATWSALDYYEEGLRRESDDVRCNNQIGLWYVRRGRPEKALPYLERAVKVLQKRNPNPYDGEPLYNLALALLYLGRDEEAYHWFNKAAWNVAWTAPSLLQASLLSMKRKEWETALDEVERALLCGWHNHRARAVKAVALRKLLGKPFVGRRTDFAPSAIYSTDSELRNYLTDFIDESLAIDPFNYGCLYEKYLFTSDESVLEQLKQLMHQSECNYDDLALDYLAMGLTDEAASVWSVAETEGALTSMGAFHRALCVGNVEVESLLSVSHGEFFPNRLEDISCLRSYADNDSVDSRVRACAAYMLGNVFYDKRQYDLASRYWLLSADLNPQFPTVWRNLALYYYNKEKLSDKALQCMQKAFSLDETDARILMEYDQLLKRLHTPFSERLSLFDSHADVVTLRDDLVLEHATLLNQLGRHEEAKSIIDHRIFHPWEGGEGKVSGQYQISRIEMSKQLIESGEVADLQKAVSLLTESLDFPHNLGEGKLYGAQDNDIYFYLGEAYSALSFNGQEDDRQRFRALSLECYEKGTVGPTEPAAAMYYNDAKADKIFFAALCYRRLSEMSVEAQQSQELENRARSLFHKLLSYGEQHIFDNVTMDYFAVSLPDLLVWDGDLNQQNFIHCNYMLALGHYGLGNIDKAHRYATIASSADPNNQGIASLCKIIG